MNIKTPCSTTPIVSTIFLKTEFLRTFGLLVVSTFCILSAQSQTVTNPSTTPGYDSTKAATTYSSSAGVSLVTESADYQPGSTATFTG